MEQNKKIELLVTIQSCLEKLVEEERKSAYYLKKMTTENEELKNKIVALEENYKKQLEVLEIQMEVIEDSSVRLDSVILGTWNANRNGRPPLPQELIDEICRLVSMGYSRRQVAEHLGLGVGTVLKYAKGIPKPDVKPTNHFIE